ncbi:MAG: superoxide dismutase, partial [Phycisphaerales bacterium]|nr:superoxide dismutase [Phycisphaerales bacterium]
MAFELAPLPYAANALEPHIDARTMEIHHGKHHAGYTAKFNAAIEGTEWANKSVEEILGNLKKLPETIQGAVRNNGGGYANHCLFWEVMSPNGGGAPTGELATAINAAFGNFESFKTTFANTAVAQFGSGWGWLVVDDKGALRVYATANQDSPLMQGHTPILGLDVWEHAYYKKYGPGRADYAAAWWNVVN